MMRLSDEGELYIAIISELYAILKLIILLHNDENEVALQHKWGICISKEFALVINTFNYMKSCQ